MNLAGTPYAIGSGATGLIINDTTPRTIAALPSCIAGMNGSRMYVSDTVGSATPTYHLPVAGSGSTTVNSPAYCNGTAAQWQYD
ncbi:MAG: hypothetical protein WBW81_14080 [Methylocella sp.]